MKDQLKSKMDTVLNFTASISPDFEKGPNLGQTLFGIAKSAMKDTEADGAVLYLVSRESNTLKPEIIVGNYVPPFSLPPEAGNSLEDILEYIQTADIRIGDGVIGKVAESVSPIFLRTGAQFKEYDFYRSPDDPLCISSLIVAPLTIKNRLIGVIATIRCPPGEVFSDIDFITFRTFADYSALIIEHYYGTIELIEKREMSREISIAAEIQNKLLPEKIPKLSSAQIAIFSKAARGISGDYYDIIPINNGEIGLLICDVVGKGVPASLFMVTIHSIISLVGQKLNLPGSILTYLNRGLMKRIGSEQFATMSIFTYDEGTHTVTYSNAAHPPLLLYRPERQTFQEIDTRGLPVGVEQTEKYENTRFTVQKGDIVVLFTDGISEARASDGREYTLGKLKNRIQQSSSKSAKEIISSIKGDIEAFTAGTSQHDDQTIIVFRVIK